MTKEEKDLLLKYLCMALPYGVICTDSRHGDSKITEIDVTSKTVYCYDFDEYARIENVKPYLRPMSSITEEEQFDYYKSSIELGCIPELPIEPRTLATDWLLKKHFDFRNLIERGLAIEVTESNNPYKE